MFTIDLADELEGTGVTVNTLHPATFMNTTMVRQSGMTPISSVEEGADAILQLAVSPHRGQSGLYFNGQRERVPTRRPMTPTHDGGSNVEPGFVGLSSKGAAQAERSDG